MKIESQFEKGKGCFIAGEEDFSKLLFEPHKKFTGVALKHLITGKETGGCLSCHLVKVDSGCCLESHTHPDHLEVHEVIAGKGTYIIDDREYLYQPGSIGVIPVNMIHRVEAGKEGLYILATFSPALL